MKRIVIPLLLILALAASAGAAERTVFVIWDHSPDLQYLVSYRVYWRDVAAGTVHTLTVPASQTRAEIQITGDGTRTVTFTVYVTAIDTRGLESIPSNSVRDGTPFATAGLRLTGK